MNRNPQLTANDRCSNRNNERGAALITMLLVSILLLGAGGALIMTTMMSAPRLDRGAAGLLRCRVRHAIGSQRAARKRSAAVTSTDRMSCTAIIPDISNGPANDGALRWPPSVIASMKTVSYPLLSARSPVVTGSPSKTWIPTVTSFRSLRPGDHGSNAGTPDQKTFGTVGGTDEVTVRFSPQGSTTLTPDPHTFPLTLDSALGSFVIERPSSSTADDVAIAKTTFDITISQTLPWVAETIIEGSFEGEVDTTATTLKVTFNKAYVKADGTKFALNLPVELRCLT